MNKFNGKWGDSQIKDLLVVHKNRSHAETAVELTRKWGVLVTRDSVKNKYNSVIMFSENEDGEVIPAEPVKSREFFDKSETDEGKRGKRTYFVTSAIAGCPLDKDFFNVIELFCKESKAKLIVLPMRGIGSKDEQYDEDVLEQLSDYFYTDYTFNSNLEAFDVALNPNQINPLTGLQRITKKSSVLVASPKQNMEPIPVSNVGTPHIIHSTGSVTNAMYKQNRIGMLATEDHVIGGLIIEVADDEIFHIRQVQAGENGSFYDLNKRYTKKGVVEASAKAFVMGDTHCGNEDPTAINAWHEVIDLVQPKNVFIHDLVDSRSVSHHEEHNLNAKVNRDDVFKFLETELDNVGEWIKEWSSRHPKVEFRVVKSNHDEHIDRYLDEGRYVKDHHNLKTALELAIYRVNGLDPVQQYLYNRIGKPKNFTWLKRDEDFKIAGCQLAAHGDKGPNGSFGTIVNIEKSYLNSITGHTHTPRILRNAWQVGTSTKLRLPYTKGPSSWLHASAILYENGQKQMIISIDGAWRLK